MKRLSNNFFYIVAFLLLIYAGNFFLSHLTPPQISLVSPEHIREYYHYLPHEKLPSFDFLPSKVDVTTSPASYKYWLVRKKEQLELRMNRVTPLLLVRKRFTEIVTWGAAFSIKGHVSSLAELRSYPIEPFYSTLLPTTWEYFLADYFRSVDRVIVEILSRQPGSDTTYAISELKYYLTQHNEQLQVYILRLPLSQEDKKYLLHLQDLMFADCFSRLDPTHSTQYPQELLYSLSDNPHIREGAYRVVLDATDLSPDERRQLTINYQTTSLRSEKEFSAPNQKVFLEFPQIKINFSEDSAILLKGIPTQESLTHKSWKSLDLPDKHYRYRFYLNNYKPFQRYYLSLEYSMPFTVDYHVVESLGEGRAAKDFLQYSTKLRPSSRARDTYLSYVEFFERSDTSTAYLELVSLQAIPDSNISGLVVHFYPMLKPVLQLQPIQTEFNERPRISLKREQEGFVYTASHSSKSQSAMILDQITSSWEVYRKEEVNSNSYRLYVRYRYKQYFFTFILLVLISSIFILLKSRFQNIKLFRKVSLASFPRLSNRSFKIFLPKTLLLFLLLVFLFYEIKNWPIYSDLRLIILANLFYFSQRLFKYSISSFFLASVLLFVTCLLFQAFGEKELLTKFAVWGYFFMSIGVISSIALSFDEIRK